MEKNIVKARNTFAENGLGKVDQREHIVGLGLVSLLADALVLVHSDVPAAVESHFVKSVAVVAVVALGVLNGKDSTLDVARKGRCDLMNGRFVAVADEVELAVVEGLTAHPILQEKSVLALVYVGNTVARALAPAAAMLINDGVAVREPSLNARGKGIDDLVLGRIFNRVNVRIAPDNSRKLPRFLGQTDDGEKICGVEIQVFVIVFHNNTAFLLWVYYSINGRFFQRY